MITRQTELLLLLLIISPYKVVAQPCYPNVKLEGCQTKPNIDNPNFHWHRYNEHRIVLTVQPGCESSTIDIYWTYETCYFDPGDLSEFKNKPTFIYPPFALDIGEYILNVCIMENPKDNPQMPMLRDEKCYLKVVPTQPIAIIKGGSYRRIRKNQDLSLIGETSINMDCLEEYEECGLFFKWTCNGIKYCNNFVAVENNIVIPKTAFENEKNGIFMVTLLVAIPPDAELISLPFDQTILITDYNIPIVNLICDKNCPPTVTNFIKDINTNYHLECISKCKNLVYEWSICSKNDEDDSFDCNHIVQISAGIEFQIENDHVRPSQSFFIIVKVAGTQIELTRSDVMDYPVLSGNWQINTDQQDPLKKFSIYTNCSHEKINRDLTYQIYEDDVLIATSATRLVSGYFAAKATNPQIRFKVHDRDSGGLYDCGDVQNSTLIEFVDPTTGVANISSTVNSLYRGEYDQHPPLLELLRQNRVEHAAQLLNILVEQVRPMDDTEEGRQFRKNFGMQILQDIMKFSFLAPYELKQVAGVLKNLMQVVCVEEAVDRTIMRLGTALIRSLALMNEQGVKEQLYPHTQQGLMMEMSRLLLGAVQENMFETNEIDMEMPPVVNVTTLVPPLPENVPIEHYPDYQVPNDEFMAKLRDYEEATNNILDIARTLGRGILQTLVTSNRSHWLEMAKSSTMQIYKARGEVLGNMFLNNSVDDTSMQVGFSKDFLNKKNEAIGVVLTCYNHTDLIWWYNPIKIQTGVMDLVIYDSNNNRIEHFESPNTISLNRYATTDDINFTEVTISVPNSLLLWNAKLIDQKISVTKLIINPGEGVLLHFDDLENETLIDVVGTIERRPNYNDFTNATLISHDKPFFNFNVKERLSDSTAVYVGILPNKQMLPATRKQREEPSVESFELDYRVAYEIPKCVSWVGAARTWTGTHCKVGENVSPQRVQCDCYEGSTFAATYLKAEPMLQTFRRLEVPKREYFNANYLIFSNIFVVFLIYCLICLLVKKRTHKTEKDIIFLADNLICDRFAYLIIVKTGKYKYSGTTSRVCLKLKGLDGNSHSHVLNRPDPEKRLLQTRGEDWFVLATQQHLGDLTTLKLWYDSTGCRPSWYCENVEVYDLQADGYWFFNVKTWFDVTRPDGVAKFKLRPLLDKPKNVRKKCRNVWKMLDEIFKMDKPAHTWNLISTKQNMSHLQQITLLLSIVCCCYFFSMAFYGMPKFHFSDNYSRFGHFALYPEIFLNAICSGLVSFAFNFGILYMFRHPNEFISKIVAWLICSALAIITLSLLVVYGFWLTKITSMLCMSSAILAVVFNIFFLEYGYIIVRRLLIIKDGIFPKRIVENVDLGAITENAEQQREILFEEYGPTLLRGLYMRYYPRLKAADIKKREEKEKAKLNFLYLLQDVVTFGLYMAVLCVVVLANKDPQIIYSNKEVTSMVVYGEHQHTMGLFDVRSTEDLINYLNETIIPTVHALAWYHTYFVNDPGQMADYNNKFLGVVRIRQHRMPKESCPLPELANTLELTCVSEFTYTNYLNQKRFPEGWGETFFYEIEYNRLEEFWYFDSSGSTVTGMYRKYPGGGYSAVLGRTKYNSYFNLDYLVKKEWLDTQSRMICIEFLIYNVNYNVFNSVKLILERTAAGYFDQTYSIQTSRLLFVRSELEFITVFFIFAFHILLLIIVFKKFFGLISGVKAYFKDFWNIADLFIIALSLSCITLFSYRIVLVREFLTKLKYAKKNEFIGFGHLFQLEDGLNVAAGILVCLTTIRLWKLLRFAQIFQKLERILIYSIQPLFVLFCCQLLIILGFGICGFILFGSQSNYFRGVWNSICSLFYISLNLYKSFDYSILGNTRGFIGNMYYILFMFITFTIYTLYVTAIIIGCGMSEEYFTNKRETYTVWTFLREQFFYYLDIFGIKLRDDLWENARLDKMKVKSHVFPKRNSVRYADGVSVPKLTMAAMEAVAKAVVTNMTLSENDQPDFDVMADAVQKVRVMEYAKRELMLLEGNELFFVTKDEDGKRDLTDNRILVAMARIVRQLVDETRIEDAPICLPRFNEIHRALFVMCRLLENIHVLNLYE